MEGMGQAGESHGYSVEVMSEGQGKPKTTGQVQNCVRSSVETHIHIEWEMGSQDREGSV